MPIVEHAGTALFLKRWLRRPLAMGAVVPSGRLLAEALAQTTLRRHFRGPRIIEGDAARLSRLLGMHRIDKVAAIVSGLPLLSLSTEVVNGIVNSVFETLPRGAALVQFTYGAAPPVPRSLRASLRLVGARGRRIWRNVPPAVIWTFRRPAA
jgi:phosphatidylethanolamine/phosphatidyl-N-methylethanolamine N-methyltransferase